MSLYTQIFEKGLSRNPDGYAFICDQKKYTYRQVKTKVLELEEHFKRFGIKKNCKVIIKLKNPLSFVFSLLTLSYLEAIPVPVYHGIIEEKLKGMCDQYDINFLIMDADDMSSISKVGTHIEEIGQICQVSENIDDQLEGVVLILSTSGTTSIPKAIMLTENNIVSNVEGISEYLKLELKDHILLIKDMSHSSSIVGELFVGLYNGSEIVFTTKLLRVVTILKLMQEYEITIFFAVPTILKELMVSHKKSEFNLSKLRIINFYGASMNSDDIVRLIAGFPWANIIYSYGQTEASPRVTYIEKDMLICHQGACGKPICGVKVFIVDENGCECAPCVEGEVVVEGPNVMRGYYRDEEKTNQTIKDGKLYTGDIAYLDTDGFLHIVGRKDNMFIRGGKNIYPEEIENVLISHQDVLEALVKPVNKSNDVMDIIAYLVRKDCTNNEVSDIWDYCRSKLEDYKIPKQIIVVSQLEKTPSGKIKRNQ